jgi:hypothetical protein
MKSKFNLLFITLLIASLLVCIVAYAQNVQTIPEATKVNVSNDVLSIILTALLTILGILGPIVKILSIYLKKIFTAIKETSDVGIAMSEAIKTIDNMIADNVIDRGEIETAKAKFAQIKIELEAAKAAWSDLFHKAS